MGTLSGSLSIALQALSADQGAVAVTTNNVANANTPGYTREVPVFQENPPLSYGSLQFGTGVSLGQTQSIRDNILQIRIDQESQQSGQLNSFVSSMQQMQALFNEAAGVGLQTPMTNFFNAWQQLAADPRSGCPVFLWDYKARDDDDPDYGFHWSFQDEGTNRVMDEVRRLTDAANRSSVSLDVL